MDPEHLAHELYEAAQTARPVALLTERYPDLDWNGARAIARSTDAHRRTNGDSQIGWKLGWTSEAMRMALGIDRPNWGTLWASQVAGAELHLDRLIHPKIEPELVWKAPVDFAGPEVTAADIAAADGEWALGLEVVDPRFPSFAFAALDNTADNSSSAAIRLGDFQAVEDAAAVAAQAVHLSDGPETRTGEGSQAMGSPVEAVAWLVRSLAVEGLSISEGDIVFTGGLTAPFDAAAGVTYRLAGAPFEDAVLSFV